MRQPDAEKRRLTRQWFRKAEHDLLATEQSVAHSPILPDVAVYHCQQAVEKGLEGFPTSWDHPSKKTHDPVQLVQQCEEVDEGFAELRSTAAFLTPYATAFRYPGDDEDPEPDEALEAPRRAREAVAFISARLGDVLPR